MSSNTNKLQPDEHQVMTEDELQELYKDDPSPLIQAALAARRENLRIHERLQTLDEILAEVREGRGVSARDDD